MNDITKRFMISSVTTLVVLMLLFFDNTVQSRIKYHTYLEAQAKVLSCRASNRSEADRICGPVPTLDSFR